MNTLIYRYLSFQLIFEGIRGSSYRGDAAIDNVVLMECGSGGGSGGGGGDGGGGGGGGCGESVTEEVLYRNHTTSRFSSRDS